MKGMRRIMVLCLVLSLAITGYTPLNASAASKKKAKLNKKSASVKVGKTVKLKVKNTNKKVKWSVKSGKKYITLKNKQKKSVVVHAKKAGSAKVTAKVGKKKLTCKIKVTKASSSKTQSKKDTKKKDAEVPGKNVALPAGATAFNLGTKKLAIGMPKADVYTVLGSLSSQEIRDTGKSPQGFDVIAYNTNDYKEYLLIYLQDDKVAGICGIGASMSYGDAVAGASGTALSSDWKNSPDYKTKTKRLTGARSRDISGNECAYAFYDALDQNQIYCIQAYDPVKVGKTDDMVFMTNRLSYDAAVTASIATETGRMLNAFRVYHGKSVLTLQDGLAKCAQAHCDQAAANKVSKLQSRGDNDGMFGILESYGVSAANYDEQCYYAAADAISFANSVIEDENMHEELVGSSAGVYRYIGVGMAASSANTYLTIDCVDVTNY